MAKTAIPIRANGSVPLRRNGSAPLVEPGSRGCCCGGCASPLVCENCGDAQTPITMALTLPALTPRLGLWESGIYGSYEVFGTFPGLTLCLMQDTATPCRWFVEAVAFRTMYVDATSTESFTTTEIQAEVLVGPGPTWRAFAFLYGPITGSPNPAQFLIYDTGWVAGTPPCGSAKSTSGLTPLADPFEQPADHPERVWATTSTGTSVATPCCEIPI